MGQCPGCHTWNSFVEEPVRKSSGKGGAAERSQGLSSQGKRPSILSEISMDKEERILTGIGELDRVLGGGVVPGSLVLVGGDPGIGKSTLLLQMCRLLAESGKKVLYISGEESLQQIKMRAQRIGQFRDTLQLLCETNLGEIEGAITREKPEIVIIDSIQTMYQEEVSAAPGSVSQVRESTGVFLKLAKGYGISIFIVGHVTKEGTVAGLFHRRPQGITALRFFSVPHRRHPEIMGDMRGLFQGITAGFRLRHEAVPYGTARTVRPIYAVTVSFLYRLPGNTDAAVRHLFPCYTHPALLSKEAAKAIRTFAASYLHS